MGSTTFSGPVTSTNGFVGVTIVTGVTSTVTPFPITGLAAAQGGTVTLTGGASTTSGNAGGPVALLGGAGGATGIGGAVTITGAAGGATSGAGGAVTSTGGAGTAGNAAGGASANVGGAGQGSAAGGAAILTGGVAGATGTGGAVTLTGGAGGATSGTGGAVNIIGGAGTNGNANGGAIILAPGAKQGSGIDGATISRGILLLSQGAPTAKTVSATLTAAEIRAGIITVNQGGAGASAQQLPDGTAMDAGFPNAAAGDAFDFSVINISTVDAEDASITTNTGWTLVGSMDIEAYSSANKNSSGRFRARKTGSTAWTLYRMG